MRIVTLTCGPCGGEGYANGERCDACHGTGYTLCAEIEPSIFVDETGCEVDVIDLQRAIDGVA